MQNIFHQIQKNFSNPKQHHTVAVALDMSKVFVTVNKNKLILTNITKIIKFIATTFKDNKHALNTMTHSQNSNESTSGVRQVEIRSPTLFKIYISKVTLLPKDVQISTYGIDIRITASHTEHHLSPTTHSTIFLQCVTLFTPDPVEYGKLYYLV